MNPTFEFTAKLWEMAGEKASWFLVNVPEDESDIISEMVPDKRGFGSVRVEVTVGETTWNTSIFPSKQKQCYVLPVKKAVRKAEGFDLGDDARYELTVLLS